MLKTKEIKAERTNIGIDIDVYRRLKDFGAKQRTTMKDATDNILDEFLKRKGVR